MARIELDQVTKRFGDIVAVKDVTVTIEDNEFFCFFGPPSSGKTTMLRLLLGLETPDEGEIRINGRPVNRMTPAERNLAVVFQNLALFPHMTAGENIAFPLVERGMATSEIKRRVDEAAAKLSIAHILHKRPGFLSGGERQRVAIGRALARDAAAYLMDDPISALDARLREAMRVELKRLQREIGHTLIYVTHDQEEAMSVADRMAIVEEGSVRQIAPPQIIYHDPNSRYVASLVGSPTINLARAKVEADGLRLADIGWRAPIVVQGAEAGSSVDVGFRPEAVQLVAPHAAEGFDADLVSVEPLGASTTLVANSGGLMIKAQVMGQITLTPGERIRLAPRLDRLLCFRPGGGERLAIHGRSSGD
jgi:multiple sugar transport system ATP-binding protein